MPETMAEKRNTIGMTGVDHHGFALTEPKMKPDVAVQEEGRRDADDRDEAPELVVDAERLLADVVDAEA